MAIRFLSAESIDGKVGIGTTTPYAKLDVVNGNNNNEALNATDFRFVAANRAITTERANMEIYTNNAQAADLGGSIGFGGRNTDSSANDSLFATIKAGKSNATTGNYLGYLEIGTSDTQSDITRRFHIDYTGATFAGDVTLAATKHLRYADDKILIGNTNSTLGSEAISIGYDADSTGNQSIGIGYNPEASGTYSVAIGYNVTASGTSTFVFGTSGSHSDDNTLVASGLDLKVTGTGTSTFAGNVSIIKNSSSTGSSVSPKILIYNEGSGDSALQLSVSGSIDYYLGVDNSDDKFKIGGSSWDSSPYLTIDTSANATFAGTVTATEFIGQSSGIGRFSSTTAGVTVVSAEGAYASSGSVKLYEAKRSGGAVGGDWSYDDATTDMSLGTNTNHAFSLKTNNTRRILINNTGNVLIGGTTDKKTLTVYGGNDDGIWVDSQGSQYTSIAWGNNGTERGNIAYDNTNTNFAITSYNASSITMSTNASGGSTTERMRINNDGNVGIGGVSSGSKLEIIGGGYNSIRIGSTQAANTNKLSGISMNNYEGNGTSIFQTFCQSGSNSIYYGSADSGFRGIQNHYFMVNAGSDATSGHTTAMLINSSGNVGIGTTSPTAKLEIVTAVGADAIRMNYGQSADIFLGFNSANPRILLQDNSNVITHDFTSNANNYIVGSNVGIGTTSPLEKLNVVEGTTTAGTFFPVAISGSRYQADYGVGIAFRPENNSSAYSNKTAIVGSGGGYGYNMADLHFCFNNSTTLSDEVSLSDSKVTMKRSGNVGIGTNNPQNLLNLSQAAGANIRFDNTTTGNYFIIGEGVGTNNVFSFRGNSYRSTDTLSIDFVNDRVGVGTISPSKKLSVDGGIRVGNNGTEAGASKIYGDIQRPDALSFTKRNYTLLAGSSTATYFLARQWHDNINWGAGNINVIIWGVYYGKTQYNKSDFSCRYGYSSSDNDVIANFNPGSMAVPYWTSATTVSGNIEYRDLKIDIPAYQRYSFEIINPGAMNQTYDINNTSHNTCYFYPH